MTTPQSSIAEDMLREIRRMVKRISEHSKYLSRHSGLTVPQLLCLKAVGDLEGQELTITVIAKRIHLSPATVSRIVDRLEISGLVLRERTAEDRRKVRLALTASGWDRYQTLPPLLQDTFVSRLESLPDAERERLLGAMRRVNALMEAEDLDAAPLLTPGTEVYLPEDRE